MMIKVPKEMATSVIDGLKSQPIALPLVVVNLCALAVVGFVLYTVAERSSARDVMLTEVIKNCGPQRN